MGNDTQLWILRLAKVVVVFVYAVVTLNLVLLALGFVLRLFGASTSAAFTEWVYRTVARIMEPFRGHVSVAGGRRPLDSRLLAAVRHDRLRPPRHGVACARVLAGRQGRAGDP
jgi:uncharacterized protein YggT (Ycf19 family)